MASKGITDLGQFDFMNRGMYPGSQLDRSYYSSATQMPLAAQAAQSDYDPAVNPLTGEPVSRFAQGGIAALHYEDGGDIQEPAPEEVKPASISDLAEQIKFAYRSNQNYDDLWKEFQSRKAEDPKEWYKKELEFLGGQQGWQIGQNTEGRNEALMPQLTNTITEAKAAGLGEEEIANILGASKQEANIANQNRIAEEGAKGQGWVNQNIPGGWTTVGAAAALAAAPYAYGALAGTTGAGGLTAASVPSLTTGLAVPTTGALAGGAGTIGAGTAAGAGGFGLTAASVPSLATGLAVPTTGALAAGAGGAGAVGTGLTAKQLALANMGIKTLGSAMGGGEATQGGYGSASSAPAVRAPQQTYISPTILSQPKYGELYRPYTYEYGIRRAAEGGMMYANGGGISTLGSYSDGGRLLKGPGDGMSDDIPASIGESQPAALADGEFVIPADVVSHLGNGSTEAGAKQLYKMMDKIRHARTGNSKQGKQINPDKFLPKG